MKSYSKISLLHRRYSQRKARPLVLAATLAIMTLFAGCIQTDSSVRSADDGQTLQSAAVSVHDEKATAAFKKEESGKAFESLQNEGSVEEMEQASLNQEEKEEKAAIAQKEQVEQSLQAMTLEEKAAQIFLVVPEDLSHDGSLVTEASQIEAGFHQIPVAGIIVFKDNLQSPEQITAMNQGIMEISKKYSNLPALLAIDEEGGSVVRAASNEAFGLPRFPDAAELGESGNAEAVYEEGKSIGAYLRRLGFNLDFAPDADVLTNPDNTVVARRAYSPDPALVAQMADAFAQGLLCEQVLPCYKHFPGHGNTAEDTHEGYAYSSKSLAELESCELIPFASGIQNGIPMIMAGHISLPAVTQEDTPASLSPVLVQHLLKEQMGFSGVVVSDAMNMGALADHYDSSEAVLKALEAGVDLILMPGDLQANWQAVIQAVQSGRLSQERLDDAVRRILMLKASMSSTGCRE